jgi:hypothetical protein
MDRPNTMCVLAGGYSARAFDLSLLPGIVIAVNDSAYYSPRWDICVSMDRLWAENRAHLMEKNSQRTFWLRRSTMRNIRPLPNVYAYECNHLSSQFSDQKFCLNGTNSGAVALNLAYQMHPRRLYLVGFDLRLGPRGERHWYPDYPWKNGGGSKPGKLREWEIELSGLMRQLEAADIETVRVLPELKGGSPARRPLPSFGGVNLGGP